jgi:Asp-tRNA(Asn)/Glu-tRNA(Gln) amidotransferase A subunit family amidase
MNPADLSAAAGVNAIREGRIASLTLVQACLGRIAERDGEIRAFARLAPDARLRAAQADRVASRGLLHGVPVAIKDLIDTAGLATEYGSAACAGNVPRVDAACVTRLRAAGAIVIGKTETTEFAHLQPAPTVNPHDHARTPGGSSAGSAAAVAAGMAPVALGTQTGGSVIRPASFCGIFGFKSSWRRTDVHGVHELAGSLDTVGWFARTAEDLSLLGRVLLRDWKPHPMRPQVRLARVRGPFDAAVTPAMHEAVDAASARLAAGGARIEELSLPPAFAELNPLHRRIVSVEAARAFARYAVESPQKLSDRLRQFIAEGRRNAADHAEALVAADAARAELARLVAGFDGLLCPAATGEAPVGLDSTGDPVMSAYWSLLRVPAATIPCAHGPAGMPMGIQLLAPMDHDEALLALVEWATGRLGIEAAPIAA